MKNKLITTALAGSLCALGTSAIAQTTISGNLNFVYGGVKQANTQGSGDYRFWGKESQINFANKGKLNNGLDYAAGFSWEIDGNEALGASTANDSMNAAQENMYIDIFYAPGSYISLGVDHLPSSDQTLTNLVGTGYLGAPGVNNSGNLYPASFNNANWGVGVSHNTPVARLTFNYQPNATDKWGGHNDSVHNVTNAADVDGNGRIEAGVQGDLGVKGLYALAYYMKQDHARTAGGLTAEDPRGYRVAARYNFGKITVAGDYIKVQGTNPPNSGQITQTNSTSTNKGKSAAIAYAISPNLSVGYVRSTADTTLVGTVDEKVNHYQIGYNLGAIGISAEYRDGKGVGGQTGSAGEGEHMKIHMTTRF